MVIIRNWHHPHNNSCFQVEVYWHIDASRNTWRETDSGHQRRYRDSCQRFGISTRERRDVRFPSLVFTGRTLAPALHTKKAKMVRSFISTRT